MEEGKGRKIIMFPLPFVGHFNPMIQLARIFHHRGFSVTILHTSFNFPDPSHYPLFTFRTIPHNNAGGEDPMTQPDVSSMDLVAFIRLLRQTYAEPFRQSLAAEVGREKTVCCLVYDAVWVRNTEVAAEELGIRRMVLITQGVASFCAFAALPLLRDKNYLHIQASRLHELVTEVPPLKVKDLPVMETNEPEEFYLIATDMVKGANSSSGVICNTFEDLERLSLMDISSKSQVPIFPIGPFHKHNDNVLPTTKNIEDHVTTNWLNKQEPESVIYVSFGSLADIEEKELLKIAWGLRNSERPFLWVVRPGFVRGTEWLEALPSGFVENIGQKGKFVKWVNQLEVLAHSAVGAFWTHCGWNSTLESICEGVPMICTPCFTDQFVNARYIVDVWRIGIELERTKMDKKEIERVLRSIISKEGDGIREMCSELKERANVCLRKDGSSSKYLDKLVNYVMSFDSNALAS
ncbi:PREDICTED: UDP-glycosyltransferase 76F1-like [Camelina sativa]|uniref:UDP-glycosyltransferase 76F1-like n=1 Tax=Camelina sativa TaxID=90675 RepID=A0ABM0ZID3_CAMSA|nr:PREDICTED: UDP-glycosyltransferase 76F1-like [Camelina sativa]